jgi:two-component system cell cycle response regulator CtrA
MQILLGSHDGDRAGLLRRLAAEGRRADLAEPFPEIAAIAEHSGPFDLVILAVPGCADALPALRDIRRRGLGLPVLVLAARTDPEAEGAALHAGADDVLAWPVPFPLLLARLQALLRRALGHSSALIGCGNVVIDQARRTVSVDGRPVRVTRREFDVLEMLLLRRGTVLSKEHCMARLYGSEDGPEARILDVFVCKLRRKLAAAGAAEILRTAWGRGYGAEDPGPAAIAAARARFAAGQPRARRAHLALDAAGSAPSGGGTGAAGAKVGGDRPHTFPRAAQAGG